MSCFRHGFVFRCFFLASGWAVGSVQAFYTHQPASLVIGQPDAFSNSPDQNIAMDGHTLEYPVSVTSDGSRLFVADSNNHRALIYQTLPQTNNVAADLVAGQPDLTTFTYDPVQPDRFSWTAWAVGDGTRLLAADEGDSRILIFNTLPLADGASANLVLGQPDLYTGGGNTGGVSAHSLWGPCGFWTDGTRLAIADTQNNRVLIYSTFPTTDNQDADSVLGQPNMATRLPNNGGINADTLYTPQTVYWDGARFLVAERNNNRVLIFNHWPASNFESADVVVGQPDMQTGGVNTGGLGPRSLNNPLYAFSDGTRLFIADHENHRILVYLSMPTQNHAAADIVLGQPDMYSNTPNQGGVSAQSLYRPYGMCLAGGKLWVADHENHRVLMYDDIPPTPTPSPTPDIPGNQDFAIQNGLIQPELHREAVILFRAGIETNVRLRAFDLNGRCIAILADRIFPAGTHELRWNGNGLASGLYILLAEWEGKNRKGKVALVR